MNRLPALLLLSLISAPALAEPYVTDLAMIDAEVARFAGAPLGALGGAAQPADRRLRLAHCSNPLALSWHAGRRDTVLVQCPDAGGWRLFVPMLASGGGPAAPPAVLRGEGVTVAIIGPGFAVSQPGEALESGAIGSWVRVKTAAAQPMRAQVVRPGLVTVDLGD